MKVTQQINFGFVLAGIWICSLSDRQSMKDHARYPLIISLSLSTTYLHKVPTSIMMDQALKHGIWSADRRPSVGQAWILSKLGSENDTRTLLTWSHFDAVI